MKQPTIYLRKLLQIKYTFSGSGVVMSAKKQFQRNSSGNTSNNMVVTEALSMNLDSRVTTIMKEHLLPITFRTVDDEIASLIMNLYLPIPEVYNKMTTEDRYRTYAIFLMANIGNLMQWLQCKPRETYIAKITNITDEAKVRCTNITCEEMIKIVRKVTPPCSRPLQCSTYIIIFSGDGLLNTASLDVYPLKFNLNVSLNIYRPLGPYSGDYPVQIKNLLIQNKNIERYVIGYAMAITDILERYYGADIVAIIHNFYKWRFCINDCQFMW